MAPEKGRHVCRPYIFSQPLWWSSLTRRGGLLHRKRDACVARYPVGTGILPVRLVDRLETCRYRDCPVGRTSLLVGRTSLLVGRTSLSAAFNVTMY